MPWRTNAAMTKAATGRRSGPGRSRGKEKSRIRPSWALTRVSLNATAIALIREFCARPVGQQNYPSLVVSRELRIICVRPSIVVICAALIRDALKRGPAATSLKNLLIDMIAQDGGLGRIGDLPLSQSEEPAKCQRQIRPARTHLEAPQSGWCSDPSSSQRASAPSGGRFCKKADGPTIRRSRTCEAGLRGPPMWSNLS
jgi:hypothetical protein